jgi:hypothetical protein
MISYITASYILLMSYNPCDIFTYYNVTEMHGLSLTECQAYNNTFEDAYIAGLSNFVPKESKQYHDTDARFVYINLSRCNNDVQAMALVMHEMMHHSLWLHNYDMTKEEEIVTWAEEQSYDIMEIIRHESNEQ